MCFDLTGKTALITGATGGIGQDIAKFLHKLGANVVLSGRRENVLKELIEKLGNNASYIVGDLSSAETTEEFAKRVMEEFGSIDILINNAGISKNSLALRMKNEDWNNILDTNLTSVFCLTRSLLRGMFKNRWGRIINISSVVGVTGNLGQSGYSAAKAGLIGMSKSLAQEVASRNITVNCVAPGYIETPMTDELGDEIKKNFMDKIPAGRIGTGDDVAACCAFLASDGSSYITGQTIHVNGGMAMV